MRRILITGWNAMINLAGTAFGIVLRMGIGRGLIYFPFASELLSCLPCAPGVKLRRAAYARILSAIGEDAVLHFRVVLEDTRTVIGKDVLISGGCYIDRAEIGDSVLIGPHAVLLAGGRHHRFDRLDIPIKHQGDPPKEPLLIGRGAWIGANATVMADVGHDAIVGAGAVVTKPVPPYAVVVGNPARILRMRNSQSLPAANIVRNAGWEAMQATLETHISG